MIELLFLVLVIPIFSLWVCASFLLFEFISHLIDKYIQNWFMSFFISINLLVFYIIINLLIVLHITLRWNGLTYSQIAHKVLWFI